MRKIVPITQSKPYKDKYWSLHIYITYIQYKTLPPSRCCSSTLENRLCTSTLLNMIRKKPVSSRRSDMMFWGIGTLLNRLNVSSILKQNSITVKLKSKHLRLRSNGHHHYWPHYVWWQLVLTLAYTALSGRTVIERGPAVSGLLVSVILTSRHQLRIPFWLDHVILDIA